MKRLLILFFLLSNCFCKVSLSQSESENLKKYWNYRDRLKKYFLKIGSGPGESLPAENRCEGCIQNGNLITSKIRWGDATIHLGYYIAVLASEYKLLMDAQQFEEAQKTKNELFYAIQAANRLDFNAEGYLGALHWHALQAHARLPNFT